MKNPKQNDEIQNVKWTSPPNVTEYDHFDI